MELALGKSVWAWRIWAVVSLVAAFMCSLSLLYSDVWYDLFRPKLWLTDVFDALWLPLWLMATCLAFVQFPKPRRKLWWLLVPAPLCLLPVVRLLLVWFAWTSAASPRKLTATQPPNFARVHRVVQGRKVRAGIRTIYDSLAARLFAWADERVPCARSQKPPCILGFSVARYRDMGWGGTGRS